MGTSMQLRKHSHGKSLSEVEVAALEVIGYARRYGLETRFSCEDSFRSDLKDILSLYVAVDKAGVDRIGIADTVGGASPLQVYDVVRAVRGVVKCDIETHFHDDTGCAIANALCALEAGATHIDTCVLGVGERNGITPLSGLMARMMTSQPDDVLTRYNLTYLQSLENLVASAVDVEIPFNNYRLGSYTNTKEKKGGEG
jgi:homocitrate synthase